MLWSKAPVYSRIEPRQVNRCTSSVVVVGPSIDAPDSYPQRVEGDRATYRSSLF
jgi:hypothetical protein